MQSAIGFFQTVFSVIRKIDRIVSNIGSRIFRSLRYFDCRRSGGNTRTIGIDGVDVMPICSILRFFDFGNIGSAGNFSTRCLDSIMHGIFSSTANIRHTDRASLLTVFFNFSITTQYGNG